MPKLSLVMPVYNVEQYLDEALLSVQAQTMSDFQVVLVNDGSTDTSAEIAARFCGQDSRFVLVDQANSGPGPGGGRNGGLAAANGDLLMFMDSDDVLRPSMFEEMCTLLDDPALDMVTTSAERLSGVTLRRSSIHDLSHPIAEASTTVAESPWLMFDSTPWNKVFRREFFDRVVGTWPAQQLYEDIVPMTTCLLRARRVGVLDSTHYLWRHRSDGSSITQQRRGIEGDLAQIDQLRRADRVVRQYGDESAKAWFDWKAYTFDFVWMLRKFAVLGNTTAQTLQQALADAMEEIGTAVLPTLSEPIRACTNAVIAGDLRRARVLGARHRLSLVPDRRGFDAAVVNPLLSATLVSSRPENGHQRIVTSSPARAGTPQLELLASAPWIAGETEKSIAPLAVRRRGTRIHATFQVQVDDLNHMEPGETCFVKLRAGEARGELQRSIQDRVATRLGHGRTPSPVRQVFEGTSAVLIGPPVAPFVDEIELRDAVLWFRGQVGPNEALDELRITAASGVFEQRSVLDRTGERFATCVPISSFDPTVDYFLAFINSNNPGVPAPISVASDTFLQGFDDDEIMVQSSVHGQAYFRYGTNDLRALTREIGRRVPGRN